MKIQYQDNRNLPAGNGFLIFSEDLLPDGPWSLAIQRSSDQKYLAGKSAGQWVGETIRIPFENAEAAEGKLKFALGPAIVDSLDQKDQYRIDLKGADGISHPGRLKIGAIAHSMGNSLDNTAKLAEKPAPPQPEPKPAPAPESRQEPAKPDSPEPITMQEAPANDARRRWVLPLLALLALICLAWWWFDTRNKDQEVATATKTQEAPFSANQQESQPKPAQPAVIGKTTPKTGALPDAERAVREFFAGSNLTPVNALSLARSLPHNTPAEQDAIYRLYYYAASSENPAGYMEYANCLDPASGPWGTIEKNAVEAWQYYKKAEAAHDDGAAAALEKLHNWLEAQAKAGDAKAKAWLGSISK